MIRKILVSVRGDGKSDNVFAHAAALARRFMAHLEVVHWRPRPDLLPFGVSIPAMLRDPSIALGQNLAIDWNGSLEATRAIAILGDLINQAKNVTILTEAETENTASATELQTYLESHGVPAEIRNIAGSGPVPKRLLAASADLGTLLLMGACGDSHERETIFGGNTQYVVDHADLPVMLVH